MNHENAESLMTQFFPWKGNNWINFE